MKGRSFDFFKNNQLKCVYVIHNPDFNRVKIGITDNLKNRLTTLIGACGCKLELKYSTPYLRDAKKLEQLAHKHFEGNRIVGEWFNISSYDAIDFLNKSISKFIKSDEIEFDQILKKENSKNGNNKYHSYGSRKELDKIRLDNYNKTVSELEERIRIKIEFIESIPEDKTQIVLNQTNKKLKEVDEKYPIGKEMLLDRPISSYKRIDKHLYKDRKGRMFDIRYNNRQWIMKRVV